MRQTPTHPGHMYEIQLCPINSFNQSITYRMKYAIIIIIIGYLIPWYLRYKAWRKKILSDFPSFFSAKANRIENVGCNVESCGSSLRILSDLHSRVGNIASVWFGPGKKQFEVSIAELSDILLLLESCGSRAVSIEDKEYTKLLNLKNSNFFSNDLGSSIKRKQMNSLLSSTKMIKKAHYLTYDMLHRYTKNWTNGDVNLLKEFEFLISNIIGELLFGSKLCDDKIYRLLKSIINDSVNLSKLERGTLSAVLSSDIKEKLKKSIVSEYKDMLQKCESLNNMLEQTIEKSKSGGAASNASEYSDCILKAMLNGGAEPTNPALENDDGNNKDNGIEKDDSSIKSDLINILLDEILFIQSFLYWFFVNVSGNKEVEEKLLNEIDSKIGRTMSPTYEEIDDLKYLDACILESMRYSCANPIIKRINQNQPIEIAGKTIPKGTPVNLSIYLALREPELFGEDSNDFNPTRFLETKNDNSSINHNINKMKYCVKTFGFDSRQGLGKDISLSIIKCSIVSLFQRFEVSFPKNHENIKLKLENDNINLLAGAAFPNKESLIKFSFSNRKKLVNI